MYSSIPRFDSSPEHRRRYRSTIPRPQRIALRNQVPSAFSRLLPVVMRVAACAKRTMEQYAAAWRCCGRAGLPIAKAARPVPAARRVPALIAVSHRARVVLGAGRHRCDCEYECSAAKSKLTHPQSLLESWYYNRVFQLYQRSEKKLFGFNFVGNMNFMDVKSAFISAFAP